MSVDRRGDDGGDRARDFRQRSTITAHKYPTKTELHDEQQAGESYEETILRLLEELEQLRSFRDEVLDSRYGPELAVIFDDPDLVADRHRHLLEEIETTP